MGTLVRPVRHGMLTKRSISKSKTTFNARFQERWFVLTDHHLTYSTPNGSTEKGRISVNCIRCCEFVDEETFSRSLMFQVVYSDKGKLRVLYLQSGAKQCQNEWIQAIRLVLERACPDLMLKHYHGGAFLKKHWTCCRKTDKNYDTGCCNTYIADRIPEFNSPFKPPSSETALRSQSSFKESSGGKEKGSIKRKLSLAKMMDSLKLENRKSVSSNNSIPEEEPEVFSDGEISDEEAGTSYQLKHSLDSSGNSPFGNGGL